jgi:hypothetical protein
LKLIQQVFTKENILCRRRLVHLPESFANAFFFVEELEKPMKYIVEVLQIKESDFCFEILLIFIHQ